MSKLVREKRNLQEGMSAIVAALAVAIALVGCAHSRVEHDEVKTKIISLKGSAKKQKSIFVFFDGTRNDEKSKTNVLQMYEFIAKHNDGATIGLYIEGVGSIDQPLFGSVLGKGMESRILRAYEFLYQNYDEGDNVYLFGFSRGAHQGRALAGILSFVGLPRKNTLDNLDSNYFFNKIIDMVKEKSDSNGQYKKAWEAWGLGNSPLLADEIKSVNNIDMVAVEIKMLGIWDAVPGSFFKDFGECKENIGFWKRYFHWLPMISEGERYKTDSYPPIRHLAHAVSLDEKRSKFQPILLCPPINIKFTKTIEKWFPGAHADVGGGYSDSNELPGISLRWMIEQLRESYKIENNPLINDTDYKGLAHWSIGDAPANLGSYCMDRKAPPSGDIHPSVFSRKEEILVPVKVRNEIRMLKYPLSCKDLEN